MNTETKQTATLPTPGYEGKFNPYYNRDSNSSESNVVAYKNSKLVHLITLKMSYTSARAYACIWVHDSPTYISGSGMAGGYGYHRASAAVHNAIANSGIKLAQPIDGRGDLAIQSALEAVTHALGYEEFIIV